MPREGSSDQEYLPWASEDPVEVEQVIQMTRPIPQSGHNLQVTCLEQHTTVSPGKTRGPISLVFCSPILEPQGTCWTHLSYLLETKIQCNGRDPSSYFCLKVSFSKTRERMSYSTCASIPTPASHCRDSDTLQVSAPTW